MSIRWLLAFGSALVAAGALAIAAVNETSAATMQAVGTLQVDATIPTQYRLDSAYCPPGTPTGDECVRFVGRGMIPGLGRATTAYTKILPNADATCIVVNHNEAVIEIAGKGTLRLARPGRLCGPPAPVELPPSEFTVTGGSGQYAGASGTLEFVNAAAGMDFSCRCGSGVDRWRGTLTVPGASFDTSAPVIVGATSKTVRAVKGAKRARVRYAVTATDAVDGSVPASCEPRSGAWFALGRTKVRCEAVDSSGNTAKASFVVTVKRR